MLAEIQNARQVSGEGFRRWFTDDYFDLILWYADDGSLMGFQLCYDKQATERALTWTVEHGYRHNRIDAGEVPGHAKMTPLIIADGAFSRDPVAERFKRESARLDAAVAAFVYRRLKEYPGAAGG